MHLQSMQHPEKLECGRAISMNLKKLEMDQVDGSSSLFCMQCNLAVRK